ncbi:hypothetical protein F5Y10DRAFT_291840 [Nemania abortiva]|nr:hypothetical protein F5Y10DRAFT_291840 [Nemania abortiva]
MDPVSAVGLAAATAQFIGIAIKTTVLCLQIRDNADSATNFNQELETSMRDLKESQKEISSTLAQRAPRRIIDLASKCQETTNELMNLLQHIRGAGKDITTARKVLRALKERKTIEKIRNSLKEKEKLLESLLVQDIWRRLDKQTIEQSKHFATTESRTQYIIKGLERHYSNTDANTKEIVQKMITLATRMNLQFEKSGAEVQRQFEQTSLSLEKLSEERRHDAFLKTLFFPEMNERQANIDAATHGTLEWLFTPLSTLRAGWDNFGAWLRDSSSVFWICGKMGSGKSTLMAYIVDDGRTRAGLKAWSRDHKLHILSFFFWRPGTPLQKSTIGLLRSLLYEILLARPNILPRLMGAMSIHTERIPTWTDKNLMVVVVKAIEMAPETHFCVFIDGLDEFLGDYDKLINLIFKLKDLPNIKLCVSSRPEVRLTSRLAKCERLNLEDLNRSDITQHVEQRLSGTITDTSLISKILPEIVDRAEGVFLWAALVTGDVLKGVISCDDEDVLLKRVQRAPQAINDLFGKMLEAVDELQKPSLAFYINVATLEDTVNRYNSTKRIGHLGENSRAIEYMTSISIITSYMIQPVFPFGDSFVQSCQKTAVQIVAQSAGLLRVTESRSGSMFTKIRESESKWFVSSERNRSHPVRGNFYTPIRNLTEDIIPFPIALDYEYEKIGWVHRSAYDFVRDPDIIHKFGLFPLSTVDILLKLIKGGQRYFIAAPSCQTSKEYMYGYAPSIYDYLIMGPITLTAQRLGYQLSCLKLLWEHDSSSATMATDELLDMVRELDPREFGIPVYREWLLPSEHWFWNICVDAAYWRYIRQRIHKVPPTLYAMLIHRAFIETNGPQYETASELLDRLINVSRFQERVAPSRTGGVILLCRRAYIDSLENPNQIDVSYSYLQHEQHGLIQLYSVIERMLLAKAFVAFWGCFCHPIESITDKILMGKIFDSMRKISTNAGLYIGLANSGRLSLQLSTHGLETYALGRFPSDCIGDLRIACWPWWREGLRSGWNLASTDSDEEINRFIIFVPSASTTATLLRTLSFEYENGGVVDIRWGPHLSATQEDLGQFYNMTIHDIWVNKQQMSSTDQLFALACIRLHLRDLLRSIPGPCMKELRRNKIRSFLKDDDDDEGSLAGSGEETASIDGGFTEDNESEWITDEDDVVESGSIS